MKSFKKGDKIVLDRAYPANPYVSQPKWDRVFTVESVKGGVIITTDNEFLFAWGWKKVETPFLQFLSELEASL